MTSRNTFNSDSDQILVRDKKFVKTLILNRPKQLNALSDYMISRLLELFIAYEEDPSVKLILLKGSGRAFCAGGDITAVVRDISEGGNWRLGANFFHRVLIELYHGYVQKTSDFDGDCIQTISQVSILNGIVMGGGGGASLHGRFRIVTENTVFAMPETALGLFPDVGASYFLSRVPGFFGEYVGLTGKRLDGPEMLVCGLATHFVHSTKLPMLEEELCEGNLDDPLSICEILDKFAEQPVLKEKSTYRKLHIIDKCFSGRTVEDILCALEKEHAGRNDDWTSEAIKSLKKASPTSLKISLKSYFSRLGNLLACKVNSQEEFARGVQTKFREGRLQGVGQCLVREYRMVCHVMRGEISRDFFEGCRAILLDKDKNSKWNPSRLDLVTDDMVNHYFSKVNDKEWVDLKLPARLSLPASAMAKL